MAGGFLHKLWTGSRTTTPAVREALAELERLTRERPALGQPAAVLAAVLPCVFDKPVHTAAPALTAEQAAAKLAADTPLLRGEQLAMDEGDMRRRCSRICKAVQRHRTDRTAAFAAQALRRGRRTWSGLAAELLAGRVRSIHVWAEDMELEAKLFATVLRLTLLPVLARISDGLAPLRRGIPWEHGHCPTCGSWPLLGEFRGLEQACFLRCGWCASEWEFSRLQCPFCGTRDHRLLGYLHVEGEETRYRAAVCEACRSHVRMVSTLAALDEPRLLVADLATLHLDLIAAERGFEV